MMSTQSQKEALIASYIQENIDMYKKAVDDKDFRKDAGIESQIASRYLRKEMYANMSRKRS